nr:30S ribosomal protein S17e [Candidatus Njordarchaeum guaymaensis]
MGKVRIDSVKRLARNLYSRYANYFSAEFNENKEKLRNILITPSKGVRNRVAGYLTHLVKIRTRVSRGEEEQITTEEEDVGEENR